MGFQYKKVCVIGATSGIGQALAERFIQEGSFVIAVGRRKDRLAALVQKYGHNKVQAVPFDITNLDGIESFVTNITGTHEDLDCVLLNSGIQRSVDYSKPDSVDLTSIQQEYTTNYLSPLALTKAFLPFLQAKNTESALIYTTSGLALVPLLRCPNYCASKAAMHHFLLCLRVQLRDTKVKVIELLPPAVQTELHDAKHQPDIKDGHTIGMPLDEFTNEAYAGLSEGLEQIPVGTSKQAFGGFEKQRQQAFASMTKAMTGGKIIWQPPQ